MIFLKKLVSKNGSIYLINAAENGFQRKEFSSKKLFQKKVLKVLFTSIIGEHTLLHKDSGAPFLKNSDYKISISHSSNLFAIYLSKKLTIGIDIERIKKDLNKGKHYFLNASEIKVGWKPNELYLIWSAKESFYKLLEGNITDLKNDVTVLNISDNEVQLIHKSKNYTLNYLNQLDWVLVFT